jgi:hypothetical protein
MTTEQGWGSTMKYYSPMISDEMALFVKGVGGIDCLTGLSFYIDTQEYTRTCAMDNLQRWLRQEHGINISILDMDGDGYRYQITKKNILDSGGMSVDYLSYESTLQAALWVALKTLKNTSDQKPNV